MNLVAALRRKNWSPYVAGALLGLVTAAALALAGRPLSASGVFQRLAGYAALRARPGAFYWTHLVEPGFGWQGLLMVGVLLGSAVSATASGEWRLRWMPERAWREAFGPSRARRWALAFTGAALVEYAAGVAGGCTSGLAISGGVALAPGAFVFMAGMFAGGIPVAWLVGRRPGSAS